MPNLSQIKRQRMIEFLQKIREEHSDDESLIAINEIETALTEKKYGLVWEEHEERVDQEMKDKVPVFCEITEKEIKADGELPFNFLLEGDNLHSLYLLEKTHRGSIDLIYIDPPYNTKEKDFIYDDSRIEPLDGYRHSKWLSFMEKRLRIAHSLLKEDGFIFISIDDNEASQLKLLCDDIFGEENYQNTNYIQVRYAEKTLKSDMRYHKQIEQVLIYGKSDKAKPYIRPVSYDYDKFIYTVEELGAGREIELGGKKVEVFEKGQYRIVKHDAGFKEGLKEIWATGTILNGNSSGRFFRDYLTGRKDIDGLGVLYKVYDIGDDQYQYRYFTGPQRKNAEKGKYYQGVPVEKLSEDASKTQPIPNFFDMAGDFGNIRQEGGVDFNSGKKPIKMIEMFLDYFENKDILVLDFFAGSASTAHAVMHKNSLDGGKRRFILCTNNESNICEEKAFPRIKNVITGYGKYAPIPANLKYYRTGFVSKSSEDAEYSVGSELIKHIREMVQLEYAVKLDETKYVLLFSDEEADAFIADESKLKKCKAVYVSSDVLLTAEQDRKLFDNGINIYIIPDYYFEAELLEVGER